MKNYTQEEIEKKNKKLENLLMARRGKFPMSHEWLETYYSYFPEGEIVLTTQEIKELLAEHESLSHLYESQLNWAIEKEYSNG